MDDPCDEMVTFGQAVTLVANTPPRGITTGNPMHSRLAAIWGVSRDEAKRRLYRYLYGGKP